MSAKPPKVGIKRVQGVKGERKDTTVSGSPDKPKTPGRHVKPVAAHKPAVPKPAHNLATKPRIRRKRSVASLVQSVQTMVERELRAIEHILGTLAPLPENVAQAERAARTLASLSRTLREVTKMSAQTPEARSDDDSLPKDIGELRDVVSRRLAKLIADAEAAHPDEREGA